MSAEVTEASISGANPPVTGDTPPMAGQTASDARSDGVAIPGCTSTTLNTTRPTTCAVTATKGIHHIKAVYSGDDAYDGSSATLAETVKPSGTK